MHDDRPFDTEIMFDYEDCQDREDCGNGNQDDDIELSGADESNQTERTGHFTNSSETMLHLCETRCLTCTTDEISPQFSPGANLSEQTGEETGLNESTLEKLLWSPSQTVARASRLSSNGGISDRKVAVRTEDREVLYFRAPCLKLAMLKCKDKSEKLAFSETQHEIDFTLLSKKTQDLPNATENLTISVRRCLKDERPITLKNKSKWPTFDLTEHFQIDPTKYDNRHTEKQSEEKTSSKLTSPLDGASLPYPDQSARDIQVYMMRWQRSDSPQHPRDINGIPWETFARETMRIASFAPYPVKAKKSAIALAKSGFVYIGDGQTDKVMCFFCWVVKEGWRDEEDIDEIHRQLSPNCQMVAVLTENNEVSATFYMGAAASEFSPVVSVPQAAANQSHFGDVADGHSGPSDIANGQNTDRSSSFAGTGSNYWSGNDFQYRGRNDGTVGTTLSQASGDCSRPENRQMTNATNVTNTADQSHQYSSVDSYRSSQPDHASTDNNRYNSSAQRGRQITYQDLNIVVSKPKHERLATAASRLLTFQNETWPRNHFLNIHELVQAGLYFAGYCDCCRCFFCGGGLRNWEHGDNPFIEHARWFPKCAFIGQKLGQDFIDVVADLNKENTRITLDDVRQVLRRLGLRVPFAIEPREQRELIENDPAVVSLITEGFHKNRVLQAAVDLVQNNTVLSADGILSRLQAAAPLSSANAEPVDDSDNNGIREMKNENYTLRNNFICKICMDKEIGVVFLPCGHFTTCQECAWAFSKCPVCRTDIIGTTKASFSK